MYTVEKKINHNVVLVNVDNNEVMLMGKGIGFSNGKDEIDLSKVEKKYMLIDDNQNEKYYMKTIVETEPELFKVAQTLIEIGSQRLNIPYNNIHFLKLLNYLSCLKEIGSQKRVIEEGINKGYINKFKEELKFSEDAFEYINFKLGIDLHVQEKLVIAMYFISFKFEFDFLNFKIEK